MTPQPGILAPLPRLARFLGFRLHDASLARAAVEALAAQSFGDTAVIGLGASLCSVLGASIDGLHELPRLDGAQVEIPATPRALFVWLRGDDRGVLLHRGREIVALLSGAFELEEGIDAFQYKDSRDLSGFVDGTENPTGAKAESVALATGARPGLEGSSFVVVQRWVHDLDALDRMSVAEQSLSVGRDKTSNEELAGAPASAHVKRTAQESFQPEAFVLRRSMPWSDGCEHGLVFVAFGKSLAAFEALLGRMVGAEDGVVDALFRFTRPVSGATFWCPPIREGRLDLRVLLG